MKEYENVNKNEFLDYKRYLYIIISRWFWIVSCCLLGLLGAYLINRYSIREYQVNMSMIFENEEQESFTDFLMPVRYSRKKRLPDLQNEITKMSSFKVTERTLEKLDFDISYFAVGRFKETPLYQSSTIEIIPLQSTNPEIPLNISIINNKQYELNIETNKHVFDTVLHFNDEFKKLGYHLKIVSRTYNHPIKNFKCIIHNKNKLTKKYQNLLRIKTDPENEFKINLSINGFLPEKNVNFLNTFASEYLQYSLEQKNEKNMKSLDFIENQISLIEDSLSLIEKEMIHYKYKQDVVDIDLENEMSLEKYKVLQTQKSNIEFRQKYYRYIQQRFKEYADPREILSLSMNMIDEPNLNELFTEFENLYKIQLNNAALIKKEIPGLWHYNSEMEDIKSLIINKIDGIIQSNEENLKWVNQEIETVKNQIRSLPISETDFLKIDRTYELYNKYYTFLLEKKAEVGIVKASQAPDSRVLDEARVESAILLGKSKSKILLNGFLIGLFIPLAFIILLDLLNNKILSKDDIVRLTNVPILGLLGHNYTSSPIPVFEDPRSRLTEAFRRIRTDMRFYLHDKNEKIIMITSAVSGEGKTFVALNMALITSMANKKVLLLGMDLRKPALHKVFNISNKKGISSYLANRHEINDVIINTNLKNLDVAVSGPIPPNPVELMETERMRLFFEYATDQYDYIFIDTPPLAVVTDAQILSRYVSLCIFVIRQKYSRKDIFSFVNNLESNEKFKRLALLVNDMEPSHALGYDYSYGYSYNYGYGYGYKKNESYYHKSKEEEKED